jgi:lipoprotein-releasing system ATP-binding protein
VLNGVSFGVGAGERIAIVGRSGAGKSTLLHILGTLDRPTTGTVRYGEEEIFLRSSKGLARFRNEKLGFIFQFHHLLPEFTAVENVAMARLIHRMNMRRALTEAGELLSEVGLGERLHHKPGELSGGERQRVAIARAISQGPSVVLADEPTGNLDERTAEGIHDLLVKLNEEQGITLIIVSHNLDLARRMHRQIRLIEGRALEEDPGAKLKHGEMTAS